LKSENGNAMMTVTRAEFKHFSHAEANVLAETRV